MAKLRKNKKRLAASRPRLADRQKWKLEKQRRLIMISGFIFPEVWSETVSPTD